MNVSTPKSSATGGAGASDRVRRMEKKRGNGTGGISSFAFLRLLQENVRSY